MHIEDPDLLPLMNIALQRPIVAFRLDRYGRVDLAKINWTFLRSSANLLPLSVADGFRVIRHFCCSA